MITPCHNLSYITLGPHMMALELLGHRVREAFGKRDQGDGWVLLLCKLMGETMQHRDESCLT